MKRKIISCVLAASLLFSVGCYGTGMMTKEELKARTEQVDITVFTKDSLKYEFSKDHYRIQRDTLTGWSCVALLESGHPVTVNTSARDSVVTSIALADIVSLKTKEFDLTNTILLCVGVGIGGVVLFFLSAFLFVTRD